MIKRILIANRAEIACRVIATCKEMGIEMLAIYSQEDKDLIHVREATFCYCLGNGNVKETYLNQDLILSIALDFKVDAIHPGYGFLSENQSFAKKLESAGIIFIGPTAESIRLMGDKIQSKLIVEKIGMPLIPGYHGENQEAHHLLKEAKKIGFPVLIKASAGGGGKGMKIVYKEEDFLNQLELAKSESSKSFGDSKVLIEKFITKPKHIEVQVFSDTHGNHLHFYERECSVQRRYQKIIEESPSPSISQEVREKICQSAVLLTKNINYRGAGTVEFILDENQEFYFLEMNTRLQVEHPITEMVVGLDLVRLQIEVASGLKLKMTQKDVKQIGHAIECRIYAETPENNFFPSTGVIKNIGSTLLKNVRLDCGYSVGNEIGLSFDPMIAKLICYSFDRESCRRKMISALNDYPFSGVENNNQFLQEILLSNEFAEALIHTNYIESSMTKIKTKKSIDKKILFSLVAIYLNEKQSIHGRAENMMNQSNIASQDPWVKLSNFRTLGLKMKLQINDQIVDVLIKNKNSELMTLEMDGEVFEFIIDKDKIIDAHSKKNIQYHASRDSEENLSVLFNGGAYKISEVKKKKNTAAVLKEDDQIVSPMPGKIFKILKDEGQKVKYGDAVVVIEAMKMEHILKAKVDGIVGKYHFQIGDQLKVGTKIVNILKENK